jgi:transcriptional regulator of PTS gene
VSLATVDEIPFATPYERDCARVYGLVARGLAHSRVEITRQLELRSTTTSRVVADLTARRLILEVAGETAGRGRPAAVLIANPRRIGASVIYVSSQSLSGALVDLNGHLLEERTIPLAPEADNDALAAAMADLAGFLVAAMPRGMGHAGTAVSLSGLIDIRERRWLMASRWPRMRRLDIQAILEPIAGPVEICRNLDAELRARAAREPKLFAGGALLVHWGWGIGLAYAVDGQSFSPAGGSFGEIGHWRFSVLEGRRCGCGNTACLETGAALWSLLPLLRQRWPNLGEDEAWLSEQLSGCDLLSVPEIDQAARVLARALANACRLFFPNRIIISGPFVANAQLWAHFDALFRAEGTLDGLVMPQLASERANPHFEIHGAAAPLLSRAAEALLRGG